MKPEIIDDLEQVVQYILETQPASNTVYQAALRLEVYLATYESEKLI
jgi:hypothetical protein